MSEFLVTAEQRELVDSFVRPLGELFPVSRLHGSGGGERERWRQIADMGWLGVSLPESDGGVGLSAVEEALMFERFGRHLLTPAVFATVAAAALASAQGDSALAKSLADGSCSAALGLAATNHAPGTLLDVGGASCALVLEEHAATLYSLAPGRSETLCDSALWSLPLDGAQFTAATHHSRSLEVLGFIRLLVAAQLSGIAGATLAMAVDYAGVRQQFGQPIGSFQAVKHHCANMAMHAMAATDLLSFAAVALAGRREDAGFQVLAALNAALRAANHNAGLNIQIHGGMGFSDECDAHLFVKRTQLLSQAVGGMSAVRRLMVDASVRNST